jgi:hypothetical protein
MVPELRRIDPPAAELADYDRAARARTVPAKHTDLEDRAILDAGLASLLLDAPGDVAGGPDRDAVSGSAQLGDQARPYLLLDVRGQGRDERAEGGSSHRVSGLLRAVPRGVQFDGLDPGVAPARGTQQICQIVGAQAVTVRIEGPRVRLRDTEFSGVSISDAGQARNSIRAAPAGAGRAAASASIGSLISLATTRPPGPTAAAASRATGPGPLATSSTDQPGRKSARLSSSAAHGSKSWRSMNRS